MFGFSSVQRFRVQGFRVQRFRVQGFRVQGFRVKNKEDIKDPKFSLKNADFPK
jgi:hypothetical protein